MRENIPPADPSATAFPPAPGSDAATNSGAFTNPNFGSPDAPGIPGAGAQAPADAADHIISPARLRQGLLCLFIGLVAVLVAVAGAAFVRDFRASQALHAVARVATASVSKQEQAVMPARDLASLPPGTPVTPATPAGTPAVLPGSQPSVQQSMASAGIPAGPGMASQANLNDAATASAVKGGAGSAGEVAGAVPGQIQSDDPKELTAGATQGDVAATPARAKAEKRKGTARASKQNASSEHRAGGKRTARSSGTFKRCPPLGRKGAVMCRWHICNGGAGKEPACRPYLERRP
ncbi:hypothetical protein [Pseudoduganella lutea]|uniref:Uncharacterized protein n=1 Tax=Pseudoduganella lutea TaxID=321985 RepID=A0A4P6L4J6_9BURK|nr:hypothetical protein [Pseudoduganella lutea]QBE66531.1 hypothetical protein EWM63_29150 [Pseudoduganella lutea]